MSIKTISQLRLDNPSVVPDGADLVIADKSDKTVAFTMQQVKDFCKPADATDSAAGLLTPEEKSKLAGIAANATANKPDSFLLDRKNHTGQIEAGDIAGLGVQIVGKETRPTGVLQGLLVKVGSSPDRISIEPGSVCFASYTDPKLPSIAVSDVQGKDNITLAHLTDSNVSYIGMKSNGDLVQQKEPFSAIQVKTVARLAIVLHPSRTKIDHIIPENRPVVGGYNNVQEMAEYLGILPKGIYYSANNNLTLQRTAGTMYQFNSSKPRVAVKKEAKVKLQYRKQTGEYDGPQVDNVAPDKLIGGTAVNDGKWTVQPVYLTADGGTSILAGDKEYDTCTEAINNYNATRAIPDDLKLGQWVGSVVVKKEATSLSDPSMGLFVSPESLAVTRLLVQENLGFDPDEKADKTDLDAKADKAMPIALSTVDELPDAATHTNQLRLVTDARDGAKLCYSTGTQWNIINTTTQVEK